MLLRAGRAVTTFILARIVKMFIAVINMMTVWIDKTVLMGKAVMIVMTVRTVRTVMSIRVGLVLVGTMMTVLAVSRTVVTVMSIITGMTVTVISPGMIFRAVSTMMILIAAMNNICIIF